MLQGLKLQILVIDRCNTFYNIFLPSVVGGADVVDVVDGCIVETVVDAVVDTVVAEIDYYRITKYVAVCFHLCYWFDFCTNIFILM